jgi:D-psicose/D-tagatose/L-ribulose 3-epimerase
MTAPLHRPIGVHAGVWGFDWSPTAAERAIAEAAEIGYDLIEIPAVDLAAHDPEVTARLLQRHGITATVSLALSFADDITSADPAVRERGERRLADAVHFAAEIGARFVGGVVFSAMGRYLTLPTDAARRRSLEALARTAERAAGEGIDLGVEYVNRYESNLLNTAGQAAAVVDDLRFEHGAANVVVHLDTFHAAIEETSIAAAIAAAGPRLGYLHVSESHRGALGTGSIPWPAVAAALDDVGYTGPLTVETFSPAVVGDAAAIDIGLWRTTWSEPRALAAASFDFVAAHLADEATPTRTKERTP